METYGPDNKATVPRGSDPKWRYFWKLLWPSEGEPAESSTDGVEQVVPEGFPAFEETMEKWGNSMLQAVATVAKLLAVGYGLEEDTFKEMLLDGRHLLAPTGMFPLAVILLGTSTGFMFVAEFMGKLKNRSTLLFAYSSLRRAPNSKVGSDFKVYLRVGEWLCRYRPQPARVIRISLRWVPLCAPPVSWE